MSKKIYLYMQSKMMATNYIPGVYMFHIDRCPSDDYVKVWFKCFPCIQSMQWYAAPCMYVKCAQHKYMSTLRGVIILDPKNVNMPQKELYDMLGQFLQVTYICPYVPGCPIVADPGTLWTVFTYERAADLRDCVLNYHSIKRPPTPPVKASKSAISYISPDLIGRENQGSHDRPIQLSP